MHNPFWIERVQCIQMNDDDDLILNKCVFKLSACALTSKPNSDQSVFKFITLERTCISQQAHWMTEPSTRKKNNKFLLHPPSILHLVNLFQPTILTCHCHLHLMYMFVCSNNTCKQNYTCYPYWYNVRYMNRAMHLDVSAYFTFSQIHGNAFCQHDLCRAVTLCTVCNSQINMYIEGRLELYMDNSMCIQANVYTRYCKQTFLLWSLTVCGIKHLIRIWPFHFPICSCDCEIKQWSVVNFLPFTCILWYVVCDDYTALLWQKEASDTPSKTELLMFSYFT